MSTTTAKWINSSTPPGEAADYTAATAVARSSLSQQTPIQQRQPHINTETSSTTTTANTAQAHSPAAWQSLTAADMSRSWADLTESSDDDEAEASNATPPPRPTTGLRRDSIGLLSAQFGSSHLSLGSTDSPIMTARVGLHRVASVSKPVRTQIGFNLAAGDSSDGASPSSVDSRPQPPPLRAVPSALSIINKEPAPVKCEPHLEPVRPLGDDEMTRDMVARAAAGLKAGRVPEAPREGMGGTYFVCDTSGAKVGIFKPCDEEPMAPNNPKGWSGRAMGAPGMKPGVRVGEAALREVAAYLLDHGSFAGVPPACLVSMRHPSLSYAACGSGAAAAAAVAAAADDDSAGPSPAPVPPGVAAVPDQRLIAPVGPGGLKLGSLQAFAAHESDANDVAPQRYCSDSVHRIGVLDIRLLNLDRHAGNLLVSDVARSCARLGIDAAGGPQLHALVPIDHGYALPEALHNPYFEWQYWPQASVPFSEEVRAYVADLDGAADAAMLAARMPELRQESLRCLRVTTMLLKRGVAAGLTLFEMAAMMTRPVEDAPSDFEALCMDARAAALQPLSASVLPLPALSMPLFVGGGCDRGPAESGSLAMSGLGDSLGVCSDGSPNRIAIAAAGGADDDATSESPCMLASAPRPVAQSWLRTVPLASSGTDSSDWGPSAFAGLRDQPDTPSGGHSGNECARSELCMPPELMTGPMTEGRAGCGGRSGGPRRAAWEGRRQAGQTSAYPPLLEAVHPDKANYVFSGLSDAQWEVFMAQLACDLEEELAQGTWRVRRHNAPVAASCPNPVKNHRFGAI
eukprot:jgi/Ulvmu1/6741/UM030_0076.1